MQGKILKSEIPQGAARLAMSENCNRREKVADFVAKITLENA
jgi:hypothetical protein